MKSINIEEFKVTSQIELNNRPTLLDLETSEKSIEKELRKVRKKLGKLQDTL